MIFKDLYYVSTNTTYYYKKWKGKVISFEYLQNKITENQIRHKCSTYFRNCYKYI